MHRKISKESAVYLVRKEFLFNSKDIPASYRNIMLEKVRRVSDELRAFIDEHSGEQSNNALPVSDEGVPFVQLGAGDVIIGDTYATDGSHSGVSFTKSGLCEIGSAHPDTFGKTNGEIGSFLGIFATNPKSLQVLIDKLTLARDNFGIKHPAEVS